MMRRSVATGKPFVMLEQNQRRIYISADIEGCAGVASQSASFPANWEWTQARRWMTNEVVAAANVALNGGIAEVVMSDGHGNAHNIEPDLIPRRSKLVRSWPRPLLQMEGVQDGPYEAAFFIGYHNGADGKGGILTHTYTSGAFRSVRLNGEFASEGYLNAALAGEFGIPVSLVCGDDAAAEDGKRYAPDAVRLALKTTMGNRAVCTPSPAEACELIAEAAGRALALRPEPFRIPGPYRLEIDFVRREAAEMLSYLKEVELTNPRGIAATFDTMREVMQFISFAIFYNAPGEIAWK
jgi:D-amino peptidase